jgi:putative phosphoesterase
MRIACLSDVHGNYHALMRALRFIDDRNVDRIIFLGDAVGYFPSLKPLEILQDRDDITCIRGNHDDMVISGDVRKDKDHVYHHQKVIDNITQKQLKMMGAWCLWHHEEQVSFFHGGPSDLQNQYIYPDSDLDEVYDVIKKKDNDTNICVSGHTHRAFIREHKDLLFVNVGSVGMSRDYGCYGSFSIIDSNLDEVELYRFDIKEDIVAMIAEYPTTHQSVIDLLSRNQDKKPQGIIL